MRATVGVAQDAYSKALSRCHPRPLVDFVRYPVPGGFVLAVNVSPYLGQPVEWQVNCRKADEGYGGEAYAFPVRSGIDSIYLTPEQIPMFSQPEIRRAAILLNGIPPGSP